MSITLSQIEAGLERGLQLVADLAPLAALGGPAAAAIGATVGQVASMADAVVKAVETDGAILASGDIARIKALQSELQAQNATLAAQIAAS